MLKHCCARAVGSLSTRAIRYAFIDRNKGNHHMAGSKLDPIDRHILAELQADGRMTNVELAKRVGIFPSAMCWLTSSVSNGWRV